MIGFISTSFPRYEGDAAGSFVLGLARELVRRGHSVEIVAPEPAGRTDWRDGNSWLGGVQVQGAPYVRPRSLQRLFYGAGVPDNLSSNPLLSGLIPPSLCGLFITATLRARLWDAVMSHWLVPSALIAGPCRRRGARHLAIAHSADIHLLKGLPAGGFLARVVLRLADHIGFVTEELKEEFLSLFTPLLAGEARSLCSVTPMGIDPDTLVSERSPDTVREELDLAGFTVLFLGRLVPIKGVDLLIDAAGGPGGFQIVVAGDGPERARLETRARERGVDARFLGWVGEAMRAELLNACDAVALPSRVLPNGRHEGLPLTLIEAQAAGLPVVASSTPGIREMVADGESGLLVPPDDVQALKGAVLRFRDNRELAERLAKEGERRVKGRTFSVLGEFYENLLYCSGA